MALYQSIRGNFDHLDGYLTLFTPLQRRLYRKAVDIRGWEIHQFLENLFGQRLARHNIELVRTDTFATATVQGYPSSFYPVFVNLVDNAIYWLSGQNERLNRRIQLDASGKAFRVSDSGTGNPYTRLGMTSSKSDSPESPKDAAWGCISREKRCVRVGYDLILEDRRPDWSTSFLITPIKDGDNETDG